MELCGIDINKIDLDSKGFFQKTDEIEHAQGIEDAAVDDRIVITDLYPIITFVYKVIMNDRYYIHVHTLFRQRSVGFPAKL